MTSCFYSTRICSAHQYVHRSRLTLPSTSTNSRPPPPPLCSGRRVSPSLTPPAKRPTPPMRPSPVVMLFLGVPAPSTIPPPPLLLPARAPPSLLRATQHPWAQVRLLVRARAPQEPRSLLPRVLRPALRPAHPPQFRARPLLTLLSFLPSLAARPDLPPLRRPPRLALLLRTAPLARLP